MNEGNIYFIQLLNNDKFVKIGFTNNINQRISALRTMLPYKIELIHHYQGYLWQEHWLHQAFQIHHLNGEWFRFTKEMLTLLPPKIREPGRWNFYRTRSGSTESCGG